MNNFIFSNTTKVYFGKDQLHHLNEEIRRFGKKFCWFTAAAPSNGAGSMTRLSQN